MKVGYKQSEVGVIPEDWEVATATEVCDLVVDCKNRTPPFVPDSDYAVVRTPNVRDGNFVIEDLRFTDEASYHEWTARAVPQFGDIMITREAPLGEVCAVPADRKICLGQRMMLYRPSRTIIDSTYLLFALMSLPVRANLLNKIGGSTVGHAKVDDIRFLQLPLPPLPEQRAIAEALADVDGLLAALDKLIAKKRAVKTATMQQLLTGAARLPGFGQGMGVKQTEIGVIPEDWEVANLGDFTQKVGSGITPTGGSNVYKASGRPFIRSQNVGWGFLKLDDLVYIDEQTHQSFASTELQLADVLLNITGASIGRSCMANETIAQGNVNQHVCIIRTNESELGPRFLNLFLLSIYGQRQIDSFQAGGNRQGLNFGQIRSFKIYRPSNIQEQQAIAEILSDMDAEIAALEERRAKTAAVKQGMMQDLLTGRVRMVAPP